MIGGVKRWPYDVTDAMVQHGEKVTFFCKHASKACSFAASQSCFDGKLNQPHCYLGENKARQGWQGWRMAYGVHACSRRDRDVLLGSPSLPSPAEPTWLQYKLFPHRLVSEIKACEPGDMK